jgi:hypothetical protein
MEVITTGVREPAVMPALDIGTAGATSENHNRSVDGDGDGDGTS